MLDAFARQTGHLALDLARMRPALEGSLPDIARWIIDKRLIAVGCGDSYFAAIAAALSWRELAAIELTVRTPQSLLYEPPASDSALIGVSASGSSTATVRTFGSESLAKIALTCNPGSPLGALADAKAEIFLEQNEPSPGVRTYQATVTTLIALAATVGEHRGHLSPERHALFRDELFGLGTKITASIAHAKHSCFRLAKCIATTGMVTVLGSGPHLGTARFSAAKLTEAAGVIAIGQDLEEWWHVERFQAAHNCPLIVLAPEGLSKSRAMTIAYEATRLGYPVTIICEQQSDTTVTPEGVELIFSATPGREFLAPLTTMAFAPIVACEVAKLLARKPFEFGKVR